HLEQLAAVRADEVDDGGVEVVDAAGHLLEPVAAGLEDVDRPGAVDVVDLVGPEADGGLDLLVGELGAEGARLREPVLPREGVGEPAVEGDPAVGEAGEVAEVVVEPLEPGEETLDDEGDDAADVVEG